MTLRNLFILVEGEDYIRFFDNAKDLIFKGKYNNKVVCPYANKKKKLVNNFLKSIKSMNDDYLLLADINAKPCVTSKKNELTSRYKEVDKNNIIIVIKEIESWYLAGLSSHSARKLAIKSFTSTDNITKEQFNNLMPNKFDSRLNFMIEVLNRFSIKESKRKNKSFKYLVNKYISSQ